MLISIFKSVLLMSAVGAALAVVLLCLKPITRKLFSPKWQYYIWLTVLLVMILPVRFSLPQRAPDIASVQVQNVAIDTETAVTENQTFVETEHLPETRAVPKINLPQNITLYLSLIWLSGAIIAFLATVIKYAVFLGAIHKNSRADNTIPHLPKRLCARRTHTLDAPLIVGLIRPTLYLPDTEITESDMNYILMHELTHYKRRDLLYKWFAMLVCCVHWFNPLIYAVSKQIDLECEISCDAAVTGGLSQSEQNDYMNMILSMLENSSSRFRPLTTQMASGKKILKRRFAMIRNRKKTSKFVSVLSAMLAVVMLGTTVFASGVLSDLTTDDYTIEITNNGEIVELTNKPFIENGEVYLPLRELFYIVGAVSNNNDGSYIKWDNGKIDLCIAYNDDSRSKNADIAQMGTNFTIEIGNPKIRIAPDVAPDGFQLMYNAPILRKGITYIPHSYINYMLNSIEQWHIKYTVYDKNGNLIKSFATEL